MSETTFKGLAKSLGKLVENLNETIDDTAQSFVLQVGYSLIGRTPKDTGRASINWVAVINGEYSGTLPYPTITEEEEAFEKAFGDLMTATEVANRRSRVVSSAVSLAESEISRIANVFRPSQGDFLTISNNLDYIYGLAYLEKATRAKPKAPSGRIVDDNLDENDFFTIMRRDGKDKILKGV